MNHTSCLLIFRDVVVLVDIRQFAAETPDRQVAKQRQKHYNKLKGKITTEFTELFLPMEINSLVLNIMFLQTAELCVSIKIKSFTLLTNSPALTAIEFCQFYCQSV